MDEHIDIYDANLRHLGTMERLQAHMEGKWHVTFHCWVVTAIDGGKILFQLRSKNMANFPDLLDVTAAGHLEAGERVADGIREVSEELGIDLPPDSLHGLGYRVEVADQENGQRNREYQAVFIAQVDLPLAEYAPQVEEVTGLLWLPLDAGIALFSDKAASATAHGIRYDSATATWVPMKRTVEKLDFLPRIQQYYLTACIMADRLLKEEFPLSIS
ncbi:NUDIX domain-containing protein [Nonomuraea sp. M3C6]|uniref:NUDIX domain-containing protein n=1 Tax=Nonomuraea marmarensis TaxID=3351344 RepID=A0ABW7AF75_9ACTN